ncbi:MAG: M13 family metallopeptidase [Chromatiales bacterium]|nr:MAG: M13 family metallopeptidase [Chromatiales bacterium]
MRHWLVLVVAGAVVACSPRGEPTRADIARLGFDPAELSATTSPADDFFAYVNADWLASNEIPADRSSYGVMQALAETTEAQLRDIVDGLADGEATPGSTAQKLGHLYRAFLDETAIEAAGLEPLADEFARIDALKDHDELIGYLGHALRQGVQVPLDFYIDADATNPDRPLAYFWQSGLGMPDRDYYLADNPRLASVRDEYRAHIEQLFALAGGDGATEAADSIVQLETRLAERHWTRVQNRDRERIYSSQYDLAGAGQLAPGFLWRDFLEAGGFGEPTRFVIAQTDYFETLGTLLRETPMADWRPYLRFKLLKAYAPYLGAAIVAEDFDFQRRTLRGQQEMKPRWKRGIRLLNGALGEMLGERYVEAHFPPESRARVEGIVENLRRAFGQAIDELDWMSAATRKAARDKLSKFNYKIGYPDKWRDYSTLEIRPNDLVGNVQRARAFEHDRQVAKLGKPVDRSEWGMTPQTVNAYYRPTSNEVVFPAAILQPPFFDPSADDAVNYGAIGAVIGHEFSHGFDDQGRKFDGDGRLRDWWTEADAAEYEARAGGLVNQYAAFSPLADTAINGELTLGENIADLAGLTVAYRAHEISRAGQPAPIIADFTAEQRLFIGYARSWRSQYRDELLREILLSDPHAPARYRVMGVLQNVPAFYRAFDVTDASGMYLPPEQRVSIW